MTNTNNLAAIKDFNGNAGATVWWTLAGETAADKLGDAWRAQNLPGDWLPELPSIEKRMSRAVQCVQEQRKLTRPIERRGHWGIVAEVVRGEGASATLQHDVVLTVRVESGQIVYSDPWHPLAGQIAAEYSRQDGLLHRDDVALWLVDVVRRLYGTPLRPRGGLYYVLPAQVETWRRVCAAIESAGAGTSYTLPTLQGEEATRAVLDALVRDVESQANEYRENILGGNLKKRALEARVRDCDALIEHLSQYEALLGSTVETVKKLVVDVQDTAISAAYTLAAAVDAAA